MAPFSPEPTRQSTNGRTSVSLHLIELCAAAGAYVSQRVRSENWRPPGLEKLDSARDLSFRIALRREPMERWEDLVWRAGELAHEETELALSAPPRDTVTLWLSGVDALGHSKAAMVIDGAGVQSTIRFKTDVICLGAFATELGQWNARLRAMGSS